MKKSYLSVLFSNVFMVRSDGSQTSVLSLCSTETKLKHKKTSNKPIKKKSTLNNVKQKPSVSHQLWEALCEVCSALAVPWTNIIKCYNCIPLTYVLSYSEKHELLNVCYSQSYES